MGRFYSNSIVISRLQILDHKTSTQILIAVIFMIRVGRPMTPVAISPVHGVIRVHYPLDLNIRAFHSDIGSYVVGVPPTNSLSYRFSAL